MFEWLQRFSDWVTFDLLHLPTSGRFGIALNFFIYDTIKILILLFFIAMLMGVVNSYFPIERVRRFLSKKRLYGLEYFFASVLGAVTPFCSCSSVPLFIGFIKGGIPLGVTFSFLITSPLVNEVAVAVFLGMFGIKTTAIYILSGILLGMIGGFVLGHLKLEPLLSTWVKKIWEQSANERDSFQAERVNFVDRVPGIVREALGIVRSVSLYVVIGVGLGAGMHGFVPDGFFEQYIGADTWYAIPFAVVLGIPLYANAAGIVPVVQVFVAKGIPMGTSLAFMMAVVGLSLPEAALLKKVMTTKLIFLFFGVVAGCIIISGYLFNLIF